MGDAVKVRAPETAVLAASGGAGTITVDNNNVASEASSVYFTSQSGANIVKATQAALE
jgi:hypothetical protein